jgi:voltage-gated sodium channel
MGELRQCARVGYGPQAEEREMSPSETEPSQATRRPTPLQWLFTADQPVLVVIALNSIVLFLLAFEELSDVLALEALDYAFTTFFVIEFACKVRLLSLRGYFAQGWNRFDFVIVLVSLPSYAIFFFELPDLSFLLMLRAARAMKFFRFIRFVPNMPQLVDGAKRAVKASAVVVLAFFIFNFIFALISYHFFSPYSPDHFGNPILAFYSTFKVFTVEGWYEVPDEIAEAAPAGFAAFTRVYFMVVVIGGGLLGLSLVNAIFVDEMLRDENDSIEAKLVIIDDRVERRFEDIEHKLDLLLRAGSVEAEAEASERAGEDDG